MEVENEKEAEGKAYAKELYAHEKRQSVSASFLI